MNRWIPCYLDPVKFMHHFYVYPYVFLIYSMSQWTHSYSLSKKILCYQLQSNKKNFGFPLLTEPILRLQLIINVIFKMGSKQWIYYCLDPIWPLTYWPVTPPCCSTPLTPVSAASPVVCWVREGGRGTPHEYWKIGRIN